MVDVLLLSAALLSPTPLADAVARVTAADFDPVPQFLVEEVPNRGERLVLKSCSGFALFGAAFDTTTTIRALSFPNTREGNLALAPAISAHGAKVVIPIKLAATGLILYAAYKLAPAHPRWASTLTCGSGGLWTYAGVKNRQLIRRATRSRP